MGKLAKLGDSGISNVPMTYHHMLMLLLNAVGMGLILVLATFLEMKYLSGYEEQFTSGKDKDDDDDDDDQSPTNVTSKPKASKPDDTLKMFLGASNLLFLCVGLAGLMLLVNDNLARAFAIAAAIALVRFRIKLDQKSINASLLFAILAGMACGLDAIELAWTSTGIYIVLFTLLIIFVQFIKPKNTGMGQSPQPR